MLQSGLSVLQDCLLSAHKQISRFENPRRAIEAGFLFGSFRFAMPFCQKAAGKPQAIC